VFDAGGLKSVFEQTANCLGLALQHRPDPSTRRLVVPPLFKQS
jgi:hypothetical protein